ncbi:MAG: hypothetical protein IT359_04845 [Gemmatimonadaceae bacterium]|nr:hypothetical protein [Gemmatimonadaceae bacterium]
MSDAALFIAFFGGLMLLRFIVATIAFLVILPPGERCPNCDSPTLRVESRLYGRILPWFRESWCIECGWQGLLRRSPLTEPTAERHYSRQR